MSRFSELQQFGGSYEVTYTEKLTADEIAKIKSIDVVERYSKEGEPFLVMSFIMKNGKQSSEYLSKNSDLVAGDKVDPKSVEFLTLSREGDDDIYRVDGEVLSKKRR